MKQGMPYRGPSSKNGTRQMPEKGWNSAGCKKGDHGACASLRCTCDCHRAHYQSVTK